MRYNILPLRRHPTLLALAFDCHCINTCWVSVHSAVFEFIFKIIFDCRDMTWNNFQNCAVVCLYKKGRKIFLMLERKERLCGICIYAHSMQSWFHVQITFWNCFFQDLIWKFYVKVMFVIFAEHGENMLCKWIVLNVKTNFYTQHVLSMFQAWKIHVLNL